jgi:hypothetical protein
MDERDPLEPERPAEHVAVPRTKYEGFVMTDEYRAWIDEVERMPQNQSGADKTWIAELLRADAEHLARARRIR